MISEEKYKHGPLCEWLWSKISAFIARLLAAE